MNTINGPITPYQIPDFEHAQIKIFHNGNPIIPGASVEHTNHIQLKFNVESRPKVHGVANRLPNFDGNSITFKPIVQHSFSQDTMVRLDHLQQEDQPHTHDRHNEAAKLGNAYSGGFDNKGKKYHVDPTIYNRQEGAVIVQNHDAYSAAGSKAIQMHRNNFETTRNMVGGFMARPSENVFGQERRYLNFEQQVLKYVPDKMNDKNIQHLNVGTNHSKEFIKEDPAFAQYGAPMF